MAIALNDLHEIKPPGTRFQYTGPNGYNPVTGTIIEWISPAVRGPGHVYRIIIDGWEGQYEGTPYTIGEGSARYLTWL